MKRPNYHTGSSKKAGIRFRRSFLAIPYGVYMAVFTVIPMVLIILFAFTKDGGGGRLTFEFTGDNFASTFSAVNGKVFLDSVWMGLAATAICLVMGYPIAYFLATAKYRVAPIFVTLFMLPMWVNFLLRTLATKTMLDFMGIEFGTGTVLFGMVYNFLPFMILPIYTSVKKIDKSLLEAAEDLGCTEFKTVVKVVFPLSLPGMVSGITMVFVPSITTFVISDMLSNHMVTLIGDLIRERIKLGRLGIGSAISLIVLIFIFITMFFVQKIEKDDKTAGGKLW